MMQATKQEVAASLAPGLQQQGQMMQAQQLQQAMGGGVASQPAPNMVGMARGGIVGYKAGDLVEGSTPAQRRSEAGRLASMAYHEGEADRVRLTKEINALYGAKAGILGQFIPQSDTERALAQKIMSELRTMTPDEMRTVLATEGNVANMLDEGGRRTPPRLLPIAEEAPISPESQYAELMQSPSVQRGMSERQYLDLVQRDKPRATEGIASVLPQREVAQRPAPQRAYTDEENEANEANVAMATETLPAMQQAQREAPQDPRMSRYEDQLARLEAEEKDKLGSLIDFLLAAGASGGTNLGATLMGGGSGLQAREQRIKAERAQTVKNIEDLQFQRDEMQARRDETAEDRALRLQLEQMGIASAEKRSASEIAARSGEFQQELVLEQNKFNEDVRQFGEEIALRNREATARERADELTASIREDAAARNLNNDEQKALLDKVKVLNSTIETLALTDPEAAAPYRAELDRVYAGLGIDVSAPGAGFSQQVLDALKVTRGQ
jgi:hypothetical protein